MPYLAAQFCRKRWSRVLEVELDDVVVNVLDREIHLDAIDAHPLKLQARHRACGVLKQCLDPSSALLPRRDLAPL